MVSYSRIIGTQGAQTKTMAAKVFKVNVLIVLTLQAIAVTASAEDCQMHCKGALGVGDLCVKDDKICDNFPDCENGEDEAASICGCKGFTCVANGFCLDASARCNGYNSCFDNSDEINCTKSEYQQNFPALHKDDLCKMPCGRHGSCSFESDDKAVCICDDGYSGIFCENEVNIKTPTMPTPEEESYFSCDRKEISMKLFCDGAVDCADQTDEMNCTLAEYKMAKPHLPNRLLCLMPCKRTNCAFDKSQKAYCPCPENSEGVFCENLTPGSTQPLSLTTPTAVIPSSSTQPPSEPTPTPSDEKVVHESSNVFLKLAIPTIAIAGLALALWLWLSKPWVSEGSMTRPLV